MMPIADARQSLLRQQEFDAALPVSGRFGQRESSRDPFSCESCGTSATTTQGDSVLRPVHASYQRYSRGPLAIRAITESPIRSATGLEASVVRSTAVARVGRLSSVVPPRIPDSPPVFIGFPQELTPPERANLDLSYSPRNTKWCCVLRPGLNLNGPFHCGPDVRSYNKELPERREGQLDGADPARPREPREWQRTRAGVFEGERGKQFLFEAFCPVKYRPECSCTVEQFFRISPDSNASLIANVLYVMRIHWNREVAEGVPVEDRVNGDWTPEQGIQSGQDYKDYIQDWIQCCRNGDGGNGWLSYVDAPGAFGEKAVGSIIFTVVFTSNPDVECDFSKCSIEFELQWGRQGVGSLRVDPASIETMCEE